MPAERPVLGITQGDPTGTGPELICLALAEPEVMELCRPVVFGDRSVLEAAREITGTALRFSAQGELGAVQIKDLANYPAAELRRGRIDPRGGQAAYEAIRAAVAAAQAAEIDAVVTSAINKAALHAAGHHYEGHTELLAELCGHPSVTMMLVAGNLRVCHVSTHVALREAIERVRPERIGEVLALARAGVQRLGIPDPRIAVAGLNPHAGEGGLFGHEEQEYIAPAVQAAAARGWKVSGPHPGDTVFYRTLQAEFDCAVAMYHDQGHVAAKMLGIWRGVNVTLGLPIIRTSVEHGTDFAHAGTGAGDPRSLIEAIRLAAAMARGRKPFT